MHWKYEEDRRRKKLIIDYCLLINDLVNKF